MKDVRDVAMRIRWDKYETAILIDTCIKVINNKVDRYTAIQSVSAKLRKRATNSGLLIDNVYRNETGIEMQMDKIMSIIQGEEPKLRNASKVFFEMVELYRTEYANFSNILEEANCQITGINNQKTNIGKLKIAGRQVDAVFFHKPDEPYGFLSNWFYSPFEIGNIKYTSTEQYIMYQKCLIFGDEESASLYFLQIIRKSSKALDVKLKALLIVCGLVQDSL